jgi:hypothetical protein
VRRVVILLGLTVLLAACGSSGEKKAPTVAAAAGGALTPNPEPIVTGSTQDSTAEYWTKERMQNAKPVPLPTKRGKPQDAGRVAPEGPQALIRPTAPRGGAPSRPLPHKALKSTGAGGYPFPYARYRWSGPTNDLPARTWGKVFFSAPDGDYVCSGTAVSSQNKSVVWTAGHCAANPGAKSFYNDHWMFVPGYDNGKSPFGKFVGKRFFTTRAWYRLGDAAFDLAAVVVGRAKGKTLVDTVGGQGIAFNQPRPQEYVSGGYPADYPFDGRTLYVCDAPLGGNDRTASPPTIAIGCDMTGGSSGGGWLVDVVDGLGTLVSVNSYGYYSQPDAMYGPYQGNAAERLYNQASSATP